MDAVLDLSARVAVFIGAIQQLYLEKPDLVKDKVIPLLKSYPLVMAELRRQAGTSENLIKKAVDIIWINNQDTAIPTLTQCFIKRADQLLCWMCDQKIADLLSVDMLNDPFPAPEKWRGAISKLLYQYPIQRTAIAQAISYLPIQLVLASGGGNCDTLQQRILQEWDLPIEELKVIVAQENLKESWINKSTMPPNKASKFKDDFSSSKAIQMLESETELLLNLNKRAVPLSFEFILTDELTEIASNRKKRIEERILAGTSNIKIQSPSSLTPTNDPIERAETMELYALALSGGGIRSATFNLGILQGFAKEGFIAKFDYLSTVSGGGYVGSWLVSWIKRIGSVNKVNNRLNPTLFSDPMADEVRPIRWLRMFSNYLTPSSGIMSADSWTVGVTLIRNMLLNQVIIALLFCTLIFAGKAGYLFWFNNLSGLSGSLVFVISSILMLCGAFVAGLGMQSYHKKNPQTTADLLRIKKKKEVSKYLMLLSYLLAFVVSAFISKHILVYPNEIIVSSIHDFKNLFLVLLPSGFICFTGLMLVAIFGHYYQCIPKTDKGINRAWGYIIITASPLIASCAGVSILALVWILLSGLSRETMKLSFVFGFPLVLEVLSLTVVVRMALMGSYFPDERREWWGRVGGIVHRVAFSWILILGAALFGENLLQSGKYHSSVVIKAAGGWAIIVLGAVRAAFSSKSSTDNQPSALSSALDIFSRIGPYLFGLGLLIFMPILVNSLLKTYAGDYQNSLGWIVLVTLILGGITALLASRIGVNEFSMHYFYKNRLVRAYLGGTRGRADRDRSANIFTGFDNQDDLVLSQFTHANNYYGPYPILNTALNASQVSALDRQDRKAESFIFSPLYCGFDFSRTRSSANANYKSYDYGYRPTNGYAYPPYGPHIGSAMAISGAAANPNQGYHSSPATAFLLTIFNVRLGWWIGNPRKSSWTCADPHFGLPYLLSDLVGKTDTSDEFVCLSDGGHFDNMGLYELIRRHASVIVLGDGEQDDKFTCEGLANAIRRCRIDFGTEIDIDVRHITERKKGFSSKSYAIGTIRYPGNQGHKGTLIYLKSSIIKDQAVDVREYALKNTTFPHQSTGDQFFNEAQFESYRKLGLEIAEAVLNDTKVKKLFINL